ncbi:unnamed protein product, partial [Musa acuminata subsp. burmannicoides]
LLFLLSFSADATRVTGVVVPPNSLSSSRFLSCRTCLVFFRSSWVALIAGTNRDADLEPNGPCWDIIRHLGP